MDKRGGHNKLTYEFVKEQIENEGYYLISNEYINNRTKLSIKCDKGHIYKALYGNFKLGCRCPICYNNEKRNKTKRLNYKSVKKEVEKEGYSLLSKNYKNNYTKLHMMCDKGHKFKIRFSHFKSGSRCSICKPRFSKPEKEIAKYIKNIGFDIIENDRTIIRNPITNYPLELDIFVPKLNKAIEFNGRYYHSDNKSIKRDKIKKKQCIKKEIDLLVINEQNWIDNKEICLEKIGEFLL